MADVTIDVLGGKTKGHRLTRNLRQRLDETRVANYINIHDPLAVGRNAVRCWTPACVVEYLASNGADTQWAVDRRADGGTIMAIDRASVPDDHTWSCIVQVRDCITRPVAHHLWQKTRLPAETTWRQAQAALRARPSVSA